MSERDMLTTEISKQLRKELNSGISEQRRQEIYQLWDSWLKSQRQPKHDKTTKNLA